MTPCNAPAIAIKGEGGTIHCPECGRAFRPDRRRAHSGAAMTDADRRARIRDAERRVQRLLLNLEEEIGRKVTALDFDTHPYTRGEVTINVDGVEW